MSHSLKPRVRIVILGGIKYIVHLNNKRQVFDICIDFGRPSHLYLETKAERQKALQLLGMADYQFWRDSQDYQEFKKMAERINKEQAHAC